MKGILLMIGSILCCVFPYLSIASQVDQSKQVEGSFSDLIKKHQLLDPSDTNYNFSLQRILELAELNQEYEVLAENSIEIFNQGDPLIFTQNEKKEILQKAITYEQELKDTTLRGNLHLKLAGAFFSLELFDSAIYEYGEAIAMFSTRDSLLIADSYFFRGQARDYKGDLIEGMNDYHKAQLIYDALGNEEYSEYVSGGIAILFSKYGIFNEAEKIRNKLIEKAIAAGNDYNYSIQLYNQAEDYMKQNRFDEQLEYLKKANSLTPYEERDYYTEAMIKLALSNCYGEHGDFELQKKLYKEAEKLAINNPTFVHTSPTYFIAKILMAKNSGDLFQANRLANESLEAAELSKNMDHLIKSYALLSETYEGLNQPEKALDATEKLQYYKDSLFAANQATTFSYYQTLYETEKKELEIFKKTREIENITTQNQNRLRIIGFLSILVLSVGAVGFLWKNLQYQKKAKALQSKFSQELLKNQEAERVRISKDLHDGLGQSLLLIKNKVALTKDDTTGEMLDTAISELRAIARSLHPMQLEKLGLSKAASQLLEQIDLETDIFVSSEIDELYGVLKKEEELQLYRILQESINNVLKHSEASALRVTFQKIDQQVILKIEDNGKGFDFSERFNDFQSLGLKTLKERIASINGSMKVTSQKGNGTSLSFITYV